MDNQEKSSLADEDINELLGELDNIARTEDHYEYGLPLWSESASEMRNAVRNWLAKHKGTT